MSIRRTLAQTDINKDWTTTSPLSTGLVAFDLEAPGRSCWLRGRPRCATGSVATVEMA